MGPNPDTNNNHNGGGIQPRSRAQIERTKRCTDVAERQDTESSKLIGYKGNWYDVGKFVDSHPGGDVIRHFVGYDASQVMDSMHKYNVVRFRKPVGSYDYQPERFGKEMTELEMKFRKEGFYDNSFWWCCGKSLQILAVLVLNQALLLAGVGDGSWMGRLSCGTLLALFWQQSGMLMHDYMHSQLTRKRQWDEWVGVFFGTACFGISARWWKEEHIVHHTLTNTVDHKTGFVDPQAQEEAWAQNEKLFPFRQSRLSKAFVYVQHITFMPLCLFVGRFGIIIDSMREERRLDVWLAWLLHWTWMSLFLSQFSSWRTAFLVYGMGCVGEGVLHVQLLLNHYSKKFYHLSEKLETDHYRAMIECNLNIKNPWWMDWFHGGLNFHHEHHCFPRLPRNRLREASYLIQEICARNRVKYDQYGFFEALWKTLRHLYTVRQSFFALSVR